MFLWTQKRTLDSAKQLIAAARLDPTNGERAAAAARALRDADKLKSAEKWYKQAVKLTPDVSKL